MSIPEALPWHAPQWHGLSAAIDSGRVHHAMLLQGPPGLGKLCFAERAAAALLCEHPGPGAERPCGSCRSCRLVQAGSHPDRLQLAPEEERRQIAVAQVRARIADLALTPHYASRRVILVVPADALNRHAANTLLKTLEEPPGGAVFVLVTAHLASLPATIRSRCSIVRFHPPPAQAGQRWLERDAEVPPEQAGALLQWCSNAPLAARDAARAGTLTRFEEMAADLASLVDGSLDVVRAGAKWRAQGLAQVVDWQLRIAIQAMRINAMRDPQRVQDAMQGICGRLDLRSLDRLCDELLGLRNALERQLNPAEQLALEGLAVAWRDAGKRPT